jgi:hypothetical protein
VSKRKKIMRIRKNSENKKILSQYCFLFSLIFGKEKIRFEEENIFYLASFQVSGSSRTSDDLLQLSGNPFASVLNPANAAANNSGVPVANPNNSSAAAGYNFGTGFPDTANANGERIGI